MSLTTAPFSENPDTTVRVIAREWIAELGPKRGRHRIAELLGVTERWVRGLLYGEPARIDAQVFLRAMDARRLLRAERRARLQRELAEIEGDLDAVDDLRGDGAGLPPGQGHVAALLEGRRGGLGLGRRPVD